MSLRRKKYWLLLHLKMVFSYQSYAYYEVELSDIFFFLKKEDY